MRIFIPVPKDNALSISYAILYLPLSFSSTAD